MGYVCFDESTRVLLNNNGLIYTNIPIVIDIFYGVSSYARVDENIIKSTFLTANGNVGSTGFTGRHYIFASGYNYKYWCIPDSSNDGSKVIERISNGISGPTTTLVYDSYYKYYQNNPTPAYSIPYGIININSIPYRIYRTLIKSSSNNDQYVYSF